MLRLPGTVSIHGSLIDKPWLGPTRSLELYLDPHYVSDAAWHTQTVLLALLTAVLAAAVARSRSLLTPCTCCSLGMRGITRTMGALLHAGCVPMASRIGLK